MRGLAAIACTGIACSGCAQIAGIDETSSSRATLELQRVSIGTTVETSPLDVASAPQFVVPTGPGEVRLATAIDQGPGSWYVAASGVVGALYTPPDLPKPYLRELAFTTQTLSANFVAFEHPDPQPAPDSMLMLDVTLAAPYAAAETFVVGVIGAWTTYTLAGADLPAPGALAISSAIPYRQFATVTQSPAAKIAPEDTVLVLDYGGTTLTGAAIIPGFAQTTGTDEVTGTMAAITPTEPFDATIDPAIVGTRFAAQMPAGGSPTFAWELDASPGFSVGQTAGVRLLAGAAAMTDTTISGTYANPFASLMWKPMLSYRAATSRTYTVGGLPVALGATLSTVTYPAPGLTFDVPVGLPTMITLEQTALTSDGMTVMVDPTNTATVDFTVDRTTNSVYEAAVVEISVVAGTVTATPVLAVTGSDPHLTLPPGVLQTGHTYTLQCGCVSGGYPNAATGDLQTFSLPASYSTATSGVFTVVAP